MASLLASEDVLELKSGLGASVLPRLGLRNAEDLVRVIVYGYVPSDFQRPYLHSGCPWHGIFPSMRSVSPLYDSSLASVGGFAVPRSQLAPGAVKCPWPQASDRLPATMAAPRRANAARAVGKPGTAAPNPSSSSCGVSGVMTMSTSESRASQIPSPS